MSMPRWMMVFGLMAAGALVFTGGTELISAASGPGMPLMWWSIRALGLVAMISLWLGMMFGVLVSSKGLGVVDSATALNLHKQQVLAASVATALHVLLVVADTHTDVPALAALVPMTSPILTGPISLGVLGLWSMIAILLSTALRERLSPIAWRAVHATAFGGFGVALAHGWTAGTDTGLRNLYLVTGASLVAATAWRVIVAARADAGAAV